MQNTKGRKCTECGHVLDQSPSSRKFSSLICLNPKCCKWRQPQGAIACDNSRFFDRPNNTGGIETGNKGIRRHLKTFGAYADF